MFKSLSFASVRSFLKLFLGDIVVNVIINEPLLTGAVILIPGDGSLGVIDPVLTFKASDWSNFALWYSLSLYKFLYTSSLMSSRSVQAARRSD